MFQGRLSFFKETKGLRDALTKVIANLKKCKAEKYHWSRQYNEEATLHRQTEVEISSLQAERKVLRKEVPWDLRVTTLWFRIFSLSIEG